MSEKNPTTRELMEEIKKLQYEVQKQRIVAVPYPYPVPVPQQPMVHAPWYVRPWWDNNITWTIPTQSVTATNGIPGQQGTSGSSNNIESQA